MKLTEEVINDIRNNASISEVIGHYIPLNKKGKGYSAVCPFHDDHDPSLSISEDKQIYKCFVCGNGGNVFNFVMNFKKVSFPESVKEVSEIIGKPIDIEINNAPKKINKNQHLFDLLDSMINYSNYLLTGSKTGEKAKEYLKNRGIEEDIINKFNIGYNPKEDKSKGIGYLYNYLHSNNFKDEDMISTNIVRMTDSGMKDVFFNRILFPIHDEFGNPIAFTARDFEGETQAKYINTGETVIYTKGNCLYNYHRAKEACKQAKNVIIVEGTMDVIAYERAGISNVVAMLGTALTKKQIELIKSLSNNVVLSFDGDKAGKAANLKNGALLLDNGLNVSVIDNRSDLDPDEIIAKYGKNALRDLAGKRLTYIDFAMNYYKDNYNLRNYADRKEVTQKMSYLIDKISDEYDRTNYENDLYELTKIKKVVTNKQNSKSNNKHPYKEYSFALDGLSKAEYSILVMMSISQKAKDTYQKDLGFMIDETSQALAMYIIDDYRKNGECRLTRLLDEIEDEKIKNLITTLAVQEDLPDEYDNDLFASAVEKIKKEIKKRKLNDLKKKISENSSDPNKVSEYLTQYQSLLRELGGRNDEKQEY